jgi:hypothetical protein
MRADAKCRSCGAPIRWARSATTHTAIPLDAEANPNGNLQVVEWNDTRNPQTPTPVVAVNPTKALTDYRYMSHFVTCPNADKHRRRS